MQLKIPTDAGIPPRYGDGAALTADGAALTADDAKRPRQMGAGGHIARLVAPLERSTNWMGRTGFAAWRRTIPRAARYVLYLW
jgi:hypothetical protein